MTAQNTIIRNKCRDEYMSTWAEICEYCTCCSVRTFCGSIHYHWLLLSIKCRMCFLYWQKDHLVPSGGSSKYAGSSSPATSSSRVTMTSVILSITVAVLLTAVIGGGFMYFNLLQRVHHLENRVCCFLWDWYTTSGFSAVFYQKLLKWSQIWHYRLKAAISSSMKKRSRSKDQKEIKKAYVWEKVTNPQSWT